KGGNGCGAGGGCGRVLLTTKAVGPRNITNRTMDRLSIETSNCRRSRERTGGRRSEPDDGALHSEHQDECGHEHEPTRKLVEEALRRRRTEPMRRDPRPRYP